MLRRVYDSHDSRLRRHNRIQHKRANWICHSFCRWGVCVGYPALTGEQDLDTLLLFSFFVSLCFGKFVGYPALTGEQDLDTLHDITQLLQTCTSAYL